jgi:hypothetical protein
LEKFSRILKHQTPSTKAQIITKVPMTKNSEALADWSLEIGYYLGFGYWDFIHELQ